MKKIIGLDVGTTSVGWAFVHEGEHSEEQSKIINLGVRVVPLTTDETKNFKEGNSITTNADRTLARHARRNRDRYHDRRRRLKGLLIKEKWITSNTKLDEMKSNSTFSTYALRAKAVHEKASLEELAKVLFMINKKRGYKSSRKAKSTEEEGEANNDVATALLLHKEGLSCGEYALSLLKEDKKTLPVFYRSDLIKEFDELWAFQSKHYPEILTEEFKIQILGKAKKKTTQTFFAKYKIDTTKQSAKNKKLEAYAWRVEAAKSIVDIDKVAFAIAEINGDISNSSGYLGAIGDRSKVLNIEDLTVGEYLFGMLSKNPHESIKNLVFYRQDYLDEFDKIWETQSKFHTQLTDELKNELRDRVIFYQRPLKSQKGLISFCEFESKVVVLDKDGKKVKKRIGSRVAPRSSPLFQEYKIWTLLNNVSVKNMLTGETSSLDIDLKKKLFGYLNIREKMTAKEVLKVLFGKDAESWELNFDELDGNRTQAAIIAAYEKIMHDSDEKTNFKKLDPAKLYSKLKTFFEKQGINSEILDFDPLAEKSNFIRQSSYELWHLLYSFEGDNSRSGADRLYEKLNSKFGFTPQQARILSNVSLIDDYCKLSTKAIRKIMPFVENNKYSKACELAGYNHSEESITSEENLNRQLLEKLDEVKRNSLRNPVVEKILNQIVNVVNMILEHPDMGQPDEIRIELARDLKNSKKGRKLTTERISKATKLHDNIRTILKASPYNIKNASRNDIIKYKLYQELKFNGYKDLYTNEYIESSDLFSKKYDIEHILPKAMIFDDSFSNKTLCPRDFNSRVKGSLTAYDCMESKRSADLPKYLERVEAAYKEGSISKSKYLKLLKRGADVGEGFIARDLGNTQYIAKQARQMLRQVCRVVNATTGKITDRLRDDWGLINVMKELNFSKYKAAGMTEIIERKDQKIEIIKDWSKRNDHRHHAMDALVVAFTKHGHVQCLNNLNAKSDKSTRYYALYNKLTEQVDRKTKFVAPLVNFREVAKQHLESILISIKAKNKVATTNINITKKKKGVNKQITLTPRGQLHNDTIYGESKYYEVKKEKISAKFTEEKIMTVTKEIYRQALLARLAENDGDPKKAFAGKNSLSKKPILLKDNQEMPLEVKIVNLQSRYTIRKKITPKLIVDKVVDKGIQRKLKDRIKEYGGNQNLAFSDIIENPIWLNKEKNISLKSVRITGVSNAVSIHSSPQESNLGTAIDYVSTSNNHHVAIYKDAEGKLQENVVSFFEAVTRKRLEHPIVDTEYNKELGWEFQFTLKQNEMFVIPNEQEDIKDLDLLDPKNRSKISPYLFRVQKMSSKDYFFNHHHNTMAITNEDLKNNKSLIGVNFHRIRSAANLFDMMKVRINHLGFIVHVGEYL